jgi:hypothetical protein
MTTFLLLCLLSFAPSIEAADLITSQVSSGDTTDKIDFYDFHLTGAKNKKDLLWPYLNESPENDSLSVDLYHRRQKGTNFEFNYNELQAAYTKVLKDKHQLSAQSGVYVVDEENYSSQGPKISGRLSLLSQYSEDLFTNLSVARGSSLREIFLTAGNLHDLKATSINATAQYQFFKKLLSIRVNAIKHFLSRDVERTFFDSEIMAALMKYPHWVRVGFGYHTLDFNRNAANYWTPLDFYAFGPRVDLSYVFNDKLQVFFGGNYNWFEENNTFQGTGYYLKTGLRYGIREDFTLDLSYERNESIQNNTSWIAKSLFVNLTLFL